MPERCGNYYRQVRNHDIVFVLVEQDMAETGPVSLGRGDVQFDVIALQKVN